MGSQKTIRKITISLPEDLVQYADHRAKELSTSRSQVIGKALSAAKSSREEQLAAEGYRFYADEASEFAQATGEAVSAAWTNTERSTGEGTEDGGQAR